MLPNRSEQLEGSAMHDRDILVVDVRELGAPLSQR